MSGNTESYKKMYDMMMRIGGRGANVESPHVYYTAIQSKINSLQHQWQINMIMGVLQQDPTYTECYMIQTNQGVEFDLTFMSLNHIILLYNLCQQIPN